MDDIKAIDAYEASAPRIPYQLIVSDGTPVRVAWESMCAIARRGYAKAHEFMRERDSARSRVRKLDAELAALRARAEKAEASEKAPVPMHLKCPVCGAKHIDRDEWATRPHRTHLCEWCRHEWRPCEYATVGVLQTEAEAALATAIRERDAAIVRAEKAEAHANRVSFEAISERARTTEACEAAHKEGLRIGTWAARRETAPEIAAQLATIREQEIALTTALRERDEARERADKTKEALVSAVKMADTYERERDEARAERDARPAITPEEAAAFFSFIDDCEFRPDRNDAGCRRAADALRAHAERAEKSVDQRASEVLRDAERAGKGG
jgi:hypothetical protein